MLKGIPLDSPLYEVDEERGIEYRNCEAITGFFTIKNDVEDLLPEGLKPYSKPAQGGIWISHYSFSTVGEYHEYLTVIQVEDEQGDMGYYIPYIYVTNDSALAAGRELAGASKKLASIGLVKELDVVMGYLERPTGKRLVTFVMKPNTRAMGEMIDFILPKPTYLYSVRHLPPIKGKGGVTQLVKWYADIDFHTDPKGERVIFMGPGNITYDSPSVIDPVHKVEIDAFMTAVYFQFDMKLGFVDILREY
ncbi:MAG: acetoacetate decarboxylase family protein [Archaeoglobus sp.]|uniref:acetoacetate decarboxylase family protein n=1 Tax=Archaeoglobus sp. TaxID=1872626 RepID=UPI001D913326|nr:acetoacetate decarboxylase family protein [Archaeoglobus sp.]MBO8179408.1 acetoacetate decarboxylase family protein [Archaeoglobus sp.]